MPRASSPHIPLGLSYIVHVLSVLSALLAVDAALLGGGLAALSL